MKFSLYIKPNFGGTKFTNGANATVALNRGSNA